VYCDGVQLEKQLRQSQAETGEQLAQKISRSEFARAIATKADARAYLLPNFSVICPWLYAFGHQH
jgi:hypothetical protein